MSKENIRIIETFTSIQGESTYSGNLCFFIRFAGCNLNCAYCDTEYAKDFYNATEISVNELLESAKSANVRLVEITGGEPLLQESIAELCRKLLENNFDVMVETNGSISISILPEGVVRIIDCKCPGSGEADKMFFKNFEELNSSDEIKFVITDRSDYDYAVNIIKIYNLTKKTKNLLFSPAWGKIKPSQLADWMIKDRTPARLQLQIHKYIWGPHAKGV